MTYRRDIAFHAAYDKRDPDPKKDYGIHGCHIYFTLTDIERGEGVTFSVSTNWQLPHVQAETDARFDHQVLYLFHKPQAFGVDIHSKTPLYKNHSCREDCHVTGGKCYSDGSALLGEEFLQTLIAGGDEALWKRMEEIYIKWRKQ